MSFLVVSKASGATTAVNGGEPEWKGRGPTPYFTVGGLLGLAMVDSTGGFALIPNAAVKVLERGFVPDIHNPVYAELQMGPDFTSGTTAFFYSAHLRWDFVQNREWTYYAIGGLGGNVTGDKLGNHWELFPRFGIGAFWNFDPHFSLRGEVSHELIAVGISFAVE